MHSLYSQSGALSDKIPPMLPNPSLLNTELSYFKSLVERIGHSYEWIAEHSGISRRRLLYLAVGVRFNRGEHRAVILSYPEQFILETLAEVGDVFGKT